MVPSQFVTAVGSGFYGTITTASERGGSCGPEKGDDQPGMGRLAVSFNETLGERCFNKPTKFG